MRDEKQLMPRCRTGLDDDATIKYSPSRTVSGDAEAGAASTTSSPARRLPGARSKITWTQSRRVRHHLKYPSCILQGADSVGEFYSVHHQQFQQADTGTKMVHIGPRTTSTIVSKGISAGRGQNTYRGLVRVGARAHGARNFTQCDSLLIGDLCGAHTVPYIENRCLSAKVEHEATTSRIAEDQLFYCRQRGLSEERRWASSSTASAARVKELPMEFAVEAQKLLQISLEGSVG